MLGLNNGNLCTETKKKKKKVMATYMWKIVGSEANIKKHRLHLKSIMVWGMFAGLLEIAIRERF